MYYSARMAQAARYQWDGTIRSYAYVFAVIEWGDPSAYGARTKCYFCGKRGPTLGRHAVYVDAARFSAVRGSIVPDSREDRLAGDQLQRDLTVEQCNGRVFQGAPHPMCPSCGAEMLHRFLSEGRRGSSGFVTAIPAKGWTALASLGDLGPDSGTQMCTVTGYGRPDVKALVQFLASQPYQEHQATIADDARPGSVVSLLPNDES